jgi:hypothetical protein
MIKYLFVSIIVVLSIQAKAQSGFYLKTNKPQNDYFESFKDKYYNDNSFELSIGYPSIEPLQREVFLSPYAWAPWPGWDNQFQYYFKYRYLKLFPVVIDADYQKQQYYDIVNEERLDTDIWNTNVFVNYSIFPSFKFFNVFFGVGLSYYKYALSEKKITMFHLLGNTDYILVNRNLFVPSIRVNYVFNITERFFFSIDIQQSLFPIKRKSDNKEFAYKHLNLGFGLRY